MLKSAFKYIHLKLQDCKLRIFVLANQVRKECQRLFQLSSRYIRVSCVFQYSTTRMTAYVHVDFDLNGPKSITKMHSDSQRPPSYLSTYLPIELSTYLPIHLCSLCIYLSTYLVEGSLNRNFRQYGELKSSSRVVKSVDRRCNSQKVRRKEDTSAPNVREVTKCCVFS